MLRTKDIANMLSIQITNPAFHWEVKKDRFGNPVVKFNGSKLLIELANNMVVVTGDLSRTAYTVAKKLGIAFGHWSLVSNSTTIIFGDHFEAKLPMFLTMTIVMSNADVSDYFNLKSVRVFSVGKNSAEIICLDDIILMTVKLQGLERPITKSLKRVDATKNVKYRSLLSNALKAEEIIMAEIEDVEKKVTGSNINTPKRTQVTGDTIDSETVVKMGDKEFEEGKDNCGTAG